MVDRSWLPEREGYSIYVRPFIFSSGEALAGGGPLPCTAPCSPSCRSVTAAALAGGPCGVVAARPRGRKRGGMAWPALGRRLAARGRRQCGRGGGAGDGVALSPRLPPRLPAASALGVAKPARSTISILLSPVGPYFPTGLKPISLFVDELNRWGCGAGCCGLTCAAAAGGRNQGRACCGQARRALCDRPAAVLRSRLQARLAGRRGRLQGGGQLCAHHPAAGRQAGWERGGGSAAGGWLCHRCCLRRVCAALSPHAAIAC